MRRRELGRPISLGGLLGEGAVESGACGVGGGGKEEVAWEFRDRGFAQPPSKLIRTNHFAGGLIRLPADHKG